MPSRGQRGEEEEWAGGGGARGLDCEHYYHYHLGEG